ncbi:MAG: hypothetical protein NT074_06420 [Methanomicrobiales archaeon]|nr:hypothetical protein [Methanomicrobiales archaeon]
MVLCAARRNFTPIIQFSGAALEKMKVSSPDEDKMRIASSPAERMVIAGT